MKIIHCFTVVVHAKFYLIQSLFIYFSFFTCIVLMYTRNCRCTCTNIYKLCILFIYFLLVLLFIFYFLQIYTRYASRKHARVDVLCSCVGINTHNTHNISRHIHTQTSICYTCLLHTVHDRQRLRQGSLAMLLRE